MAAFRLRAATKKPQAENLRFGVGWFVQRSPARRFAGRKKYPLHHVPLTRWLV
jgi:hypothetical protein